MKWRHSLLSFAILVSLAVAAYSMNHTGISSRVYKRAYDLSDDGVPVAIVMNYRDLYERWERKGFRGRVVLNMGRYLQFVEVEKTAFYGLTQRGRVNARDIMDEYKSFLNYKNFLWLAMEGDMAREVYHVLPPAAFKERIASLSEKRIAGEGVNINNLGSRRVMTDRLPYIKEPVLLNIDASYFDFSDTEGFVRALKASRLKADLITFNLSADNPDVTEEERGRLMEAARRFLAPSGVRG